jgi:hypothetical protein
MIKVAGKEALYSASLILLVGETATISPSELPASVIEITVEKEGVKAGGLMQSGLNDVKLSVATDSGFSTAFSRLHAPNLVIYEVRIVGQTLGNMTRFDIQVTKSDEIKF